MANGEGLASFQIRTRMGAGTVREVRNFYRGCPGRMVEVTFEMLGARKIELFHEAGQIGFGEAW